MNDTLLYALIMLFSLFELAILGGVLVFYLRLRRSEGLLNALQGNQDSLLARIEMNARLEKEIVATFAQRQARTHELRRLLEQAEGISRSPQFLRELILNGHRKGLSSRQIAKNAGLSVDEVDLILAQNVQ